MRPQKQNELVDKVKDSFLSLGLAAFEGPALLMVSGGSDSVALLLLVHDLYRQEQGNIDDLLVLHVNHQLRGNDADDDDRFVGKLCAHLGITCHRERASVAELAHDTRMGVELAGRTIRYQLAEKARDALLAKHAATDKTDAACPILTAHTADDRAETLLQRLIVGGGGSSLASIPKQNGHVMRPLLNCTRLELREWLIARNTSLDGCLWREDATNLDTSYSRAYVRHTLIPLLEKRNPRIIESLNRTSDVLTCESEWMDEQARQLLPLTTASFDAPLAVLRRAIYLACNQALQEMAPEARITYEHIDLIAQEGGRNGFACQIPGGIEIRMTRGHLTFTKAKPPRHDPRAAC